MMQRTGMPVRSMTPKVDLLESLLEAYTEEQLWQLIIKTGVARLASGAEQIADVKIRFKNGHPWKFGCETWEDAVK